jgi:hypothetical protein
MEQRCEDILKGILIGGVAGFAAGTLVASAQAKNKRIAPCLRPKDDPITISGGSLTLTSKVPWARWIPQAPDDWGHPAQAKFITEVDVGCEGTIKSQGLCRVEVTYGTTTLVFHSTGPQGENMHFVVHPGQIGQLFTPNGPNTLECNDAGQRIRHVKVRTPGNQWEWSPPDGKAEITIHFEPVP